MWDLASNYTGTMIGYHAVSLLADAYVKGYADFDLDVGEVCDALTVIQVCGDGSEETYRYPLTEEDRSILRAKMNDYCMEQTGMSLDDYRAQYLDEEMCAFSFPDGQSM